MLATTTNPRVWRGPVDGDGLEGDPDIDIRAETLTTLDFDKVVFRSCTTAERQFIAGEKKLILLRQDSGKIPLGIRQHAVLWWNYKVYPEISVLEWLRTTKGIWCIEFFGAVFRDVEGRRCIDSLMYTGGRWDKCEVALDNTFDGLCLACCVPAP